MMERSHESCKDFSDSITGKFNAIKNFVEAKRAIENTEDKSKASVLKAAVNKAKKSK